MDRLWIVKFTPIFPVPGNAINVFFDNYTCAREVIDRHALLLANKPQEQTDVLIFDDLLGHNCIRPDFFPYSILVEVGPSDIAWVAIDEKIKASQQEAKKSVSVGFSG